MILKFKYEDFLEDDILNLMINIWYYSDEHGVGCKICTTYKKMCIDALKKMGKKLQKCRLYHTKTFKKRRQIV